MHKIRGKANVDHNIYILVMRPRLGAATLLILPTSKWLLPTRKQRFVCDRFSQDEVASGKLPWIH